MWLLLLLLPVFGQESTTVAPSASSSPSSESTEMHLTTDDEGYITVIQGFAAQLQCKLNTCSPKVVWYKDDILLFNGTNLVNSSDFDEKAYRLMHKVDVDFEKGCTGECSDSSPCTSGSACVDNQCCTCASEEFTLVLRNLTFEDSGRYKCQIANQSELLEFQVEVLESGLRGGFHENISYDHSECCQEKGISPICRAMCKPSEMDQYHFDPTSCKTDDYKNFLSCATDNGTRSHVHCCKTQLVPSFCYDFCSGDFQMLRRSHRLCLYYLPEIFECYNRAYLPYPDAPEDVQVNAVEHDKLSVCWDPPPVHESNRDYPVNGYTVSYKEVPNFPLFGGDIGIPLLSGDYSDIGEVDDDREYEEEEGASDAERTKRETEAGGEGEGSEDDTQIPLGAISTSNVGEIAQLRSVMSLRRRRSTIVVMTRDAATNTTAVREFNFKHVNTTETCVTLSDLRSATRYIVLVTARNDYGTSVPSERELASTNVHVVSNNDTLPNAMECCVSAGVSETCASKMCTVEQTPNAMETISIATSCRNEWPKVSPCIADQRNHTECCLRKNVQKDCLPICEGSTSTLGVHSVLCLNLDIQAIYQCLREGYETHPSSPVNVSIHDVTETSVEVRWAEPVTNADLVETFTLFIRKNEHGAAVRQVHNAVSPHTEIGLDPDSEYSVSVQSNSDRGKSLPSTTILFTTKSDRSVICSIGEPLLDSDGRPFLCSAQQTCPFGFTCTEFVDQAYCCQETLHSDSDFQECCTQQKVSADCMPSCYYNATLPETCRGELNKWVQCASEGQDHTRCCRQQNVPTECLTGCKHPFQVPDSCYSSSSLLSSCFAGHRPGDLPSAVKNLEVTEVTPHSVVLSWEQQDYDVTVFTIEVYKNGTLLNSTLSSIETISLTDLMPATQYEARVFANNEKGAGPPTLKIKFTTQSENSSLRDSPRAPDGLHLIWNYGTRVNVSWNPVTHRENGDTVQGSIKYTVYYVDSEKDMQWTTVGRDTSWAVLSNLRRDGLYAVYVTASEDGKLSRESSVITLIAQQDSLGLPEPLLTFDPDHRDSIYVVGEQITINCSLEMKKEMAEHINIDLTAGPHTAMNDHGVMWVSLVVEADSSLDTASCAVTDTDGRQNVALKHILVQFGPVATMDKPKIRAFDDHSADIVCTVKGFPEPDIRFEKGGRHVPRRDTVEVKLVKMNTYRATLHIPNVSGQADLYTCIAEKNGTVSRSDTSELIISEEVLPVNPRLILSCCEDEKVEGECLQACSIGRTPPLTNCSKFASSLLKCADDVRDHSDCCIQQNVPAACLPLCSGDVASGTDCSDYAVAIMGCFVRGHEESPRPVTAVNYQVIEKGKIKITWEDDAPADRYQYYAVYYKKADDDDDDFKVEKVFARSIELPVEPGTSYDVGVMAANAFGHSPLIFLDVAGNGKEGKPVKGRSSATYIILILLACTAVIFGIIVLGRRRELPAPLGKLIGRSTPAGGANHPSVAFENPAYVTGNEVEIRGIGRADWQNQDLQAGSNSTPEEGSEYRNGMRYSKLQTT